MSDQQGNDLQKLTHLVDTLKRVVLFDDFIDLVIAVNQPQMPIPVQLDLSPYVSATAEDVFLSLFLKPSATASWLMVTSTGTPPGTDTGIIVYQNSINIWNSNYGIQKLASDHTMYYRAYKASGGGNASWQLRLHGYTEPA